MANKLTIEQADDLARDASEDLGLIETTTTEDFLVYYEYENGVFVVNLKTGKTETHFDGE
jgi:hypothetical protein